MTVSHNWRPFVVTRLDNDRDKIKPGCPLQILLPTMSPSVGSISWRLESGSWGVLNLETSRGHLARCSGYMEPVSTSMND